MEKSGKRANFNSQIYKDIWLNRVRYVHNEHEGTTFTSVFGVFSFNSLPTFVLCV